MRAVTIAAAATLLCVLLAKVREVKLRTKFGYVVFVKF